MRMRARVRAHETHARRVTLTPAVRTFADLLTEQREGCGLTPATTTHPRDRSTLTDHDSSSGPSSRVGQPACSNEAGERSR